MQKRLNKYRVPLPLAGSHTTVTSAVGMPETFGHLRALRSSFVTRTIILLTALLCATLLLATLAQAWSNISLQQQVERAQQTLQHERSRHAQLQHAATYYQDPAIIEDEARQRLNYIRPGEHAIIFVHTQTTGSQKP